MIKVLYDDYDQLKGVKLVKIKNTKKTKAKNFNNIFAFDTETSSGYYKENENIVYPFDIEYWKSEFDKAKKTPYKGFKKAALLYQWQCAVENKDDIEVYTGRTLTEFSKFLDRLNDVVTDNIIFGNKQNVDPVYKDYILNNGKWKRPVVHFYSHNAGFEMQFLRNRFKIDKVFARNMRKPMKYRIKLSDIDIIFHDTLCLTQKSLGQWAEDAQLPVRKLVGDLDYSLVRTPLTPLLGDEKSGELAYCINDVVTMIYGIQQYRQKHGGNLTYIPMTQTGEVRLTCRNNISKKNRKWAEKCYMIDHSYSWDFFNVLLSAFAGGWTHVNQKYSGELQGVSKTGDPVVCWDFASSYPSVMTTMKFPVSEFKEIDEVRLNQLTQISLDDSDYRYIVVFTVTDVESKLWNTFISSSKCINLSDDAIIDNGKVVAASSMTLCLTDADYDIFNKVYDYGTKRINKAYEAEADYLPYEFIDTILKYFENKTSLKGDASKISLYNEAKQFINALYGCAVTKIIIDEIIFNNKWSKRELTEFDFISKMKIPTDPKKLEKAIEKSFTTYQIGVFIPAFARHRLWDAIQQFDSKIIYCDTDSVKGYFDSADIKWFDQYNKYIGDLQMKVAKHYNFNVDRFSPKTKKGVAKQLGIFEREDDCVEFKALRAKVYADKFWDSDINDYKIETTIAGLPKESGVKIITEVDKLNDDLYWSPDLSDKKCANYIEDQPTLKWVDYNGVEYISDDQYGIMIEPIGFDLSIASEYEYLLDIIHNQDNQYFDTPKIIRDYWKKKLTK